MSEQVDIRARLDEIKARADSMAVGNTANPPMVSIAVGADGIRSISAVLDHDLPAMAAALTAVLDLENEPVPSGNEGDDWYGAGWNDALFNMKDRITEALTQSERR